MGRENGKLSELIFKLQQSAICYTVCNDTNNDECTVKQYSKCTVT